MNEKQRRGQGMIRELWKMLHSENPWDGMIAGWVISFFLWVLTMAGIIVFAGFQ